MIKFFNIVTIISMIMMSVFILLQTRGASLGAGFGGSGELFTARRGIDKTLHQITIVLVVVFILSLVLGIIKS